MSEEIAMAAADVAHIERLQAQLAYEQLRADDATHALRALEARVADDADTIKTMLIEMRRYFISHNLPVGECVAWRGLKMIFHVGERDADDEAWMSARNGEPFVLRRSADERKRRRGE